MLDFSNLTPEQKELFTQMWESRQQENEQSNDSAKAFEDYISKRRAQEDDQAKAAEVLKSKMR